MISAFVHSVNIAISESREFRLRAHSIKEMDEETFQAPMCGIAYPYSSLLLKLVIASYSVSRTFLFVSLLCIHSSAPDPQ